MNYCQVCGHAMTDRYVHGKQRRVCPVCGFIHFADPKVAAVVFIEQAGKVLLVQRAFNPERGKWALPAGYVDDGEDPRAAAAREVLEETGLTVTIRGLVGVESAPAELGASLVILYHAQVVAGEVHATDDAADARWFAPDEPLPELAFESTHRMIETWLAGKHAAHET